MPNEATAPESLKKSATEFKKIMEGALKNFRKSTDKDIDTVIASVQKMEKILKDEKISEREFGEVRKISEQIVAFVDSDFVQNAKKNLELLGTSIERCPNMTTDLNKVADDLGLRIRLSESD